MDIVEFSVEDASYLFVQWASAKGVISRDLVLPPKTDNANRKDKHELFNINFDLFESRDVGLIAAGILRNAAVILVGFSVNPREVRVYHRKKMVKKDTDQLPKSIKGEIKISYHHVGEEAVVDEKIAHAAASVTPAFSTNGRFTCGTSIGVGPFQSAGTLGCLVKNGGGEMFGLTNNHVIGGSNYAPKNIPVLAPAPTDMLSMNPIEPMCVGEFCECIQLVYGLADTVDYSANLDAALFRVHNHSKVSSMQRDHYDTPDICVDISSDMLVQKVGRSTGLTSGKVIVPARMRRSIRYKVKEVEFSGDAWFGEIFVIEGTSGKFADFGDSGSLIIARSPRYERKGGDWHSFCSSGSIDICNANNANS
jgi:hypothetical protein